MMPNYWLHPTYLGCSERRWPLVNIWEGAENVYFFCINTYQCSLNRYSCNKTALGTSHDKPTDGGNLLCPSGKSYRYPKCTRWTVAWLPPLCLVGYKSRKWGERYQWTRESRKDKASREASTPSVTVIENLPDSWHFISYLREMESPDRFETTLTLNKHPFHWEWDGENNGKTDRLETASGWTCM